MIIGIYRDDNNNTFYKLVRSKLAKKPCAERRVTQSKAKKRRACSLFTCTDSP